MELKNALAVCLISMFSATLVVLVAQSLDNQAAERLEPQLARIVDELEAIRKQGGLPGDTNALAGKVAEPDLVVYFFHANDRCPTCRAIESQSHAVVHGDFADPLARGEIAWKVLNYEQPAGQDLGAKFGVYKANVVLAKMREGEIVNFKRLDQLWALFADQPAFAKFLRSEINAMMVAPVDTTVEADLPAATALPGSDAGDLPLPESSLENLPLPDSDLEDLPLP